MSDDDELARWRATNQRLLLGLDSNPVDFIARLADAWDGRGAKVFTPPAEHRALLELAMLPPDLWNIPWRDLGSQNRFKLMFAARRAIALGRACAWAFGEGRGA
jgi:hypothetical protein